MSSIDDEVLAIRSRLPTYTIQPKTDITKLITIIEFLRGKAGVGESDITPEFTELWDYYRKQTGRDSGKYAALTHYLFHLSNGKSNELIKAVVVAYIRRLDDVKYATVLSKVLDPHKDVWLETLPHAVLDPTKERDWHEASQKMIRDMSIHELAIHNLYPIPIELDYRKGFGNE